MYQRYQNYRGSGVEWLGYIPSSWDVKPGLACVTSVKIKNEGLIEETVLSLSYGKIVVKPEEKLTGLVPESFETYQIIEPGDIVIRTTDLQNDQTSLRTGLAKNRGIITSAYLNLRPLPGMLPEYVHYFLHSLDVKKVFYGMGSGLRQNLDYSDFKRMPFLCPSIEEQQRIVAFLDQKTIEVEAAIEKKRRLIELAKEQKIVLFNQVVTKGIAANAALRDSGIHWVGEIPAHWQVVPNRYIFSEVNNRSLDNQATHLSMSQKRGLIPASELDVQALVSESYEGAKLVEVGDLVLNRLKAHLAVFSASRYSGVVSPDYSVFRLKDRFNNSYYFERLLKTNGYIGEFNRRVKGIVVGFYRLYSGSFFEIKCPVPPYREQQEIVEACDSIERDNKTLIAKTEQEISTLVEFKRTLIAHAVTGQIRI